MGTENEIPSESPDLQGLGGDHYKAIGYVAVSWAFFEMIIDSEVWDLAGVDHQYGACMTSQIAGSGRKLDAFLALVRQRAKLDDKLEKKLNRFVSATTGLAERRNRVIHDPWVSLAADGKVRRIEVTARKRLKMEAEEHTTREVMELARGIISHVETFRSLIDEIKSALPPLLKKPV